MVKVHNLGGYEETRSQKEHRHGRNQTGPRRTWAVRHADVDVRKVDAGSVRFGTDVSRSGSTVWAVYLDGELLCLGATAKEARHNYYQRRRGLTLPGSRVTRQLPRVELKNVDS